MIFEYKHLFTTEFRTFKFSISEMDGLITEILSKKDEIKKIRLLFDSNNQKTNYYTDYKKPTKLYEYEKIMGILHNLYLNEGKSFNIKQYWTALYGQNCIHTTHNHRNIQDIKEQENFSSVLYLTDHGGTTFYSPNHTSETLVHFEKSEVGKLVFFPSTLLHDGNNFDPGERIIISSNIAIGNL